MSGSATTATDGTYASGAIPCGVYRVKASKAGYVTAFFGGDSLEMATPVTVLRAQTSDASLALGQPTVALGTISGSVVRYASRTPISGAYVWLYKQNADGTWPATSPGWGSPTYSLFTAADGTYSSGQIPLGSYKVRFFTVHTGSQWWEYMLTVDLATVLELSYDGQAITGVDGWYGKP